MRVRIGEIEIDRVSSAQALEAIEELVRRGQGGSIFTPNVDHVVLAEEHAAFRRAYAAASLCLADGMPIVWGSRPLGRPLPEKISGSDLIIPLMKRAAERGLRVFLLGAGPGVAEKAAGIFRGMGVEVAGVDAPAIADPLSAQERAPVLAKIRRSAPHLLLVAFGAPKQELFIHAARRELGPTVALGIGGSLDFVTGAVQRAPHWMSERGLEWLYRLYKEPRRLWRRYLLRDPKFALILFRTWLRSRPAVRLLPRAPAPS